MYDPSRLARDKSFDTAHGFISDLKKNHVFISFILMGESQKKEKTKEKEKKERKKR